MACYLCSIEQISIVSGCVIPRFRFLSLLSMKRASLPTLMDYQDAEFCCYNLDARAFFSEFSKERARRRDRCGWSRSASLRDGGDPAAGPYGERKATPGKPLKNALRRL